VGCHRGNDSYKILSFSEDPSVLSGSDPILGHKFILLHNGVGYARRSFVSSKRPKHATGRNASRCISQCGISSLYSSMAVFFRSVLMQPMKFTQHVEKILDEIAKVQPMNKEQKDAESSRLREFFRNIQACNYFVARLNPGKNRVLDLVQAYGAALKPSDILNDDPHPFHY
jgi:hypothetical protein